MVRSIILSDEVQKRFDNCIIKAKGYKKGNKKICAEEAINEWCDKIDNNIK
jgi:hypothetical protein